MKIWFDISNSSQVNFLMPIINHLTTRHSIIVTARKFSETLQLLESQGINPKVIGGHEGKSRIRKGIGALKRIKKLNNIIGDYDISISVGAIFSGFISRIKGKKSIIFSDNDINHLSHVTYPLGNFFIFPEHYNSDRLNKKFRINKKRIFKYPGFKEDVYVASYVPDPEFLKKLPFSDFITIRPENLKALYVPPKSKTIIPELFDVFKEENILFLPRYPEEREYAINRKNIYMPPSHLNGLDVCYYSKAVLTGAGTFAREAALLGTPGISFFPGKEFLTVDRIMQERGWQFKSRNAKEIYNYVKTAEKKPAQIERSKIVQKDVFRVIDMLVEA